MTPNAALSFILLGTAFLLLGHGQKGWRLWGSRVCCALVAAMGLLTLLEYTFSWNMGLDSILGSQPAGLAGAVESLRMAPTVALNFIFLATALLIHSRAPAWAQVLAISAGCIAFLAILGYVFGASILYQVSDTAPMAVPTALAFCLFSLAFLFRHPESGLMGRLLGKGPGHDMALRLFPVGFLAPLVTGWAITRAVDARWFDVDVGIAFFAILSVLVATGAIWWNSALLERSDLRRRRAEDKEEHVKSLNRELRVRTSQLESANQDLESFSYSVSHDLRAPLRAIDGFSRILEEESTALLPQSSIRHLGIVRAEVQRMDALINDLLTFARTGRKPLEKRTVPPAEIAREAALEVRGRGEDRSVEMQVDDLPPCKADPGLLRVVFVNLIDNALKFTKDRKPARIHVGFRKDPGESDQITYFVRDNGVGFDMRYADKLFGVFQRLHRADEFPGTGVGLAIVQRIIHRHGGRVWAESDPGNGATFYFALGVT